MHDFVFEINEYLGRNNRHSSVVLLSMNTHDTMIYQGRHVRQSYLHLVYIERYSTIDYGHDDEKDSTRYGVILVSIFGFTSKIPVFTPMKSTADPGDHFEVSVYDQQLWLIIKVFQLTISSYTTQSVQHFWLKHICLHAFNSTHMWTAQLER